MSSSVLLWPSAIATFPLMTGFWGILGGSSVSPAEGESERGEKTSGVWPKRSVCSKKKQKKNKESNYVSFHTSDTTTTFLTAHDMKKSERNRNAPVFTSISAHKFTSTSQDNTLQIQTHYIMMHFPEISTDITIFILLIEHLLLQTLLNARIAESL